jgi:hypothetical protein
MNRSGSVSFITVDFDIICVQRVGTIKDIYLNSIISLIFLSIFLLKERQKLTSCAAATEKYRTSTRVIHISGTLMHFMNFFVCERITCFCRSPTYPSCEHTPNTLRISKQKSGYTTIVAFSL